MSDLDRELLDAVREGNLAKTIELLDKGADINAAGGGRLFGKTPLHLAILYSHIDIVQELLGRDGIDVNKTAKRGDAAIHFASQNENLDILKLLISNPEVDIKMKNGDGLSPSQLAQQSYHSANEALLNDALKGNRPAPAPKKAAPKKLPSGAEASVEKASENLVPLDGTDPQTLLDAAKKGDLEAVVQLIEQGECDINASGKGRNLNKRALHFAAINGHVEVVNYLLTRPDLDVNATSTTGSTALHYAAAGEHPEVVRALLTHKNIDARLKNTSGLTPLEEAKKALRTENVKILETHK